MPQKRRNGEIVMADAITLFKQAALQLQSENIYKSFIEKRDINDNDEKLQELIGEFNLVRIELNSELTKQSDKDQEKITELNKKVSDIYAAIMSNESMLAYNEAKKEMENTVNYINAIVNTAANGGNPESVNGAPEEGCAGSCSSCSGCS